MFHKTTLKNGLRIITVPQKNSQAATILALVGAGSKYEKKEISGISHFLEHMYFTGTKKRPTTMAVAETLDKIGGIYNAFTSEEQTCFYARIPVKFLSQTFDVLADMVYYPKIGPKDVGKEATVIVEEIKMYRDMPQYFVLDLLDALVWPDHPGMAS